LGAECSGKRVVTWLVGPDRPHPGAGAAMIDGAFDEDFLNRLEDLWRSLPLAPAEKLSCSDRAYFCDSEGWVCEAISNALSGGGRVGDEKGPSLAVASAMAHMRFVHYGSAGGRLAPHVDLSRSHPTEPDRRSTCTFLLYLTDCARGGETALLERLPGAAQGAQATADQAGAAQQAADLTLAAVKPKRGRLLLFPHNCPHEGREVTDVPKLFLRGELY